MCRRDAEVAMNRKALYELLSVRGAVVLFSAWVFQQSALERANAALRRIDAAEDVYRTYQSTNALFNAIIAVRPQDADAEREVRRFQVYNYGLGLVRLAEVTGTERVVGYDVPQDRMQGHLEDVQRKAAGMRRDIEARRDRFGFAFVLTYGFGSLLVLLGNVLKVLLPAEAR
ncbi:hypothetical protein GCM10009416_14460 [Craurococcus roseus]|uniref:Uncharacterized protein n=1 Tax=Craurococcus roseus TaxID=77585 RepID=A0ABN1EXK0_9PROT